MGVMGWRSEAYGRWAFDAIATATIPSSTTGGKMKRWAITPSFLNNPVCYFTGLLHKRLPPVSTRSLASSTHVHSRFLNT